MLPSFKSWIIMNIPDKRYGLIVVFTKMADQVSHHSVSLITSLVLSLSLSLSFSLSLSLCLFLISLHFAQVKEFRRATRLAVR